MRKILLMTLLSACNGGWGDTLDPVNRVPGVDDAVWHAEVVIASDTWRDLMVEGCYPFHIALDGECGNHVTLVPKSEWTRPDAAGRAYDSGRIEVIGDVPYHRRGILMHEIGHAMGLSHSKDVGSIMYPSISVEEPTAADVIAAEREGGCR